MVSQRALAYVGRYHLTAGLVSNQGCSEYMRGMRRLARWACVNKDKLLVQLHTTLTWIHVYSVHVDYRAVHDYAIHMTRRLSCSLDALKIV